MSGLDVIPVKNHLAKHLKLDDIKKKVKERIISFPKFEQYKSDVEFLLLVANILEHLVAKKDKIDKKALLLEIYNEVFSLTPDDVKAIDTNVEFLFNNKKIKKQSYYKLFMTCITEWVKKKFL